MGGWIVHKDCEVRIMTRINKYDVPPENLSELIEVVSERPAVFAGNSEFLPAAAFIHGYVFARDNLGVSKDLLLLRDFSVWLSEKLGKPERGNWKWSALLQDHYTSDADCLENLPKLFAEFVESQQGSRDS